jgi:hypothetical protein
MSITEEEENRCLICLTVVPAVACRPCMCMCICIACSDCAGTWVKIDTSSKKIILECPGCHRDDLCTYEVFRVQGSPGYNKRKHEGKVFDFHMHYRQLRDALSQEEIKEDAREQIQRKMLLKLTDTLKLIQSNDGDPIVMQHLCNAIEEQKQVLLEISEKITEIELKIGILEQTIMKSSNLKRKRDTETSVEENIIIS